MARARASMMARGNSRASMVTRARASMMAGAGTSMVKGSMMVLKAASQ